MRIPLARKNAFPTAAGKDQGMAVIVVVALISIVLLYVAFNARVIHNLGRELKFIEHKQTRRFSQVHSAKIPQVPTNAPPQSTDNKPKAVK